MTNHNNVESGCVNKTTIHNAVFRKIGDNKFESDIDIKLQTRSKPSATGFISVGAIEGSLPADSLITIASIKFGDSASCLGGKDGCLPGTFIILVSPDKKTFFISFDSLQAISNGDITEEICTRISCRVGIIFEAENLVECENIILNTTFTGDNFMTLGSWSELEVNCQSVLRCNGPTGELYASEVILRGVISNDNYYNC